LAGFVVWGFPAIFLLAGDDEDPLAYPRFAKAGSVELCNITQAGLWGWEQAQVGGRCAAFFGFAVPIAWLSTGLEVALMSH
jgi:hypothetical protein